jgi:hypothetical protein
MQHVVDAARMRLDESKWCWRMGVTAMGGLRRALLICGIFASQAASMAAITCLGASVFAFGPDIPIAPGVPGIFWAARLGQFPRFTVIPATHEAAVVDVLNCLYGAIVPVLVCAALEKHTGLLPASLILVGSVYGMLFIDLRPSSIPLAVSCLCFIASSQIMRAEKYEACRNIKNA